MGLNIILIPPKKGITNQPSPYHPKTRCSASGGFRTQLHHTIQEKNGFQKQSSNLEAYGTEGLSSLVRQRCWRGSTSANGEQRPKPTPSRFNTTYFTPYRNLCNNVARTKSKWVLGTTLVGENGRTTLLYLLNAKLFSKGNTCYGQSTRISSGWLTQVHGPSIWSLADQSSLHACIWSRMDMSGDIFFCRGQLWKMSKQWTSAEHALQLVEQEQKSLGHFHEILTLVRDGCFLCSNHTFAEMCVRKI